MFFNPNFDKQRHWEIFQKPRGTIIPLPGENAGVICQWESSQQLVVGVILPAQKRTVQVQWSRRNDGRTRWLDPKECELETPTMLMRAWIGQSRGDGSPPLALDTWHMKNNLQTEVRFHVLDDQNKEAIRLKGMTIGNMYENGTICWGDNPFPKDPVVANNLLWGSPINNDAAGPQHDARCTEISHNYRMDHNKLTSIHRHRHVSGVCVCLPRTRESYLAYAEAAQCGHCSGLVPTLELQGEILAKVGEVCLCCSGACDADVDIERDRKECKCQCPCCLAMCACRCECDLTDEFIEFTRNEAGERLKERRWRDCTRKVLGEWYQNKSSRKFFAFNDHADAVFISYEKEVLEKIPESLIQTHGTHKMVIGPAFRIRNGWEIDLGGQLIRLSEQQGYIMNSGVILSPAEIEEQERKEREREMEAERLQAEREERRRRLNELGRTGDHPICDECDECRGCGNCSCAPAVETEAPAEDESAESTGDDGGNDG